MPHMIRVQAVPAMLALILFTVLLNTAETVGRWIDRQTVAVSWAAVSVDTPIVGPGDTLSMTYTATINKQCPADLRGFLVAPDGSVPVRFPVVAGGYSKPSQDPLPIRVAIAIPNASDPGLAPLAPGRYVYRVVATRYCPDGVEYDTAIPDASFILRATS